MSTYDLDTPLLQIPIPNSLPAVWTARNAVEGVQIFGGIGSGKTSGSGRTLALKYLNAGYGGLVLTAKPDEKQLWEEYCAEAKRSFDLIILEPGLGNTFNFLEYESSYSEHGKNPTQNITDLLKTVIQAGEADKGGSKDDRFWESALDLLLSNVIDLCQLAYGKVTIQKLYDIVQTLPKEGQAADENGNSAYDRAMKAARANVAKQVQPWVDAQSAETKELFLDDDFYNEEVGKAIPDARLLTSVGQFFTNTYRNVTDKTRSIIDFSFSAFLYGLLQEPVYSLFCNKPSTVTPEVCLQSKIILINLPVKTYQKVGRNCQIMFKYIWQRAMERRDISSNGLPVFLWADESQNFLHEHDAIHQATARSSRIITTYISQNLPNYLASMGGNNSDERVQSFIGTLATKIFHANADIETNKYSSELIGDGEFEKVTRTVTLGKEPTESQQISIEYDRKVRPAQFVQLKTGGPSNRFKTEGYIHCQGNALFGGENHRKIVFDQLYKV